MCVYLPPPHEVARGTSKGFSVFPVLLSCTLDTLETICDVVLPSQPCFVVGSFLHLEGYGDGGQHGRGEIAVLAAMATAVGGWRRRLRRRWRWSRHPWDAPLLTPAPNSALDASSFSHSHPGTCWATSSMRRESPWSVFILVVLVHVLWYQSTEHRHLVRLPIVTSSIIPC